MHNRTRVIAAAAITAALAAGSTAAAVASTTGAKPSSPAKAVSVSDKCTTDSDLAAALGVPVARLDQAGRAVKTALGKAGTQPTQDQVYAALASALGISQARVQQAFAAEKPCDSKAGDSKAGGSKAGSKAANSAAEARLQAAFTAAVATELHVSAARVSAALAPVFAVGHADPSSPTFAAAARSLGVSAQQLSDALMHAKESLAGGK
jgi:protein-disulfide isomerase-like protein with CxxC motif